MGLVPRLPDLKEIETTIEGFRTAMAEMNEGLDRVHGQLGELNGELHEGLSMMSEQLGELIGIERERLALERQHLDILQGRLTKNVRGA